MLTNADVDGAILRILNARDPKQGARRGRLISTLDGVLRTRLTETELAAALDRLSGRGLVLLGDPVMLLPAGHFPTEGGGPDVCCADMRRQLAFACSTHTSRAECPDVLIVYDPVLDEYGIPVHDGGTSKVLVRHCPWCGRKLPESQRDAWFDELERLGVDPATRTVPEAFRTAEWRLRRDTG